MFELAGRRRASLRGGRLRTVSLFSWSVEQNARDTQMTTRVTEGARRERLSSLAAALVSRVGFAAQRSRACTPLSKSEETERLLAVYLRGHTRAAREWRRECEGRGLEGDLS